MNRNRVQISAKRGLHLCYARFESLLDKILDILSLRLIQAGCILADTHTSSNLEIFFQLIILDINDVFDYTIIIRYMCDIINYIHYSC